ncbi:protein SSXT isoform X12 [Oncorhynchus mykiss]|uniref:protein SSXT isoform X12 n=1 Tax=Oncorhynchus mykiss TaxID=8022 RepID=UPI000B4F5FB1|nr:protein SSXT isoform X12 [Oncorhynchus mykiss]
MSVAFAPHRQRGKGDITPTGIQKLLDENNQLIQCIMDFQSKGKTAECSQYQQMLHRNLVYLATIADSNQNMQSLLPAKCDSPTPPEVKLEPPTQNMPMGPGGMNQSGVPGPQPPHGHNIPSEGMVSGGPPAPHMQSQMNGQMPGPNHMPMQGPGPGPNQPPNMPGSGSMNMPPSSHGSMGGYNHAVPSSQSMPAQGQMNMTQGPMGNYGPRPNMNMQANQGPMMHQQPPSQQYNIPPGGGGQHYQGQQNPMGMMGQGNHVMGQRPMPPYRPPQQERDPAANQQSPYEKDNGNAQYGQQQEAYQQGPPQQQGYPPQQQYPGQQGYPGPQQGYGPSQGAPGQYPQGYPQGQGQQYGAYRGPQPGPPQAQQQRPYPGYDQGQYGNYQQ